MKKILSLLLVFAMVFAVVACGQAATTGTTVTPGTTGANGTTAGNTTGTNGTTNGTNGTTTGNVPVTPEKTEFDEENIVFTFGAISDIHLEKNTSYGTEAKFQQALTTLLTYADNVGNILDAVVIAGDICETKAQIETFKAIYEGMAMPGELFFTLGNHDQESKYSNEALTLQDYKDVLGDSYFTDGDNLATGDRHMVIDGKHFIALQPASYGNAANGDNTTFSAATVAWLDATLAEITAADPNAYVYVFVHAMISDTCYGSDLNYPVYGGSNGSYWHSDDLTPTLEKYPQVITFSGHLHFPINDERSIMQDKFTSIGTGSVAYLAIENGYSNTASATVPQNAGNVSSGHVVEIDENGNVRITRLNLTTGEQFGESWVLYAPAADGSHLTSYTADRATTNNAPSMDGVTLETPINVIGGNRIASVQFAAGTDDSFVHHYEIKVTNVTTNTVVKEIKWLTDFYLYTNPADMATTYSIGLGAVVGGNTYKIEVTAVDSWGAKSATVAAEINVLDTFDSTLPEALIDIDFNADGTATDKKGVGTVTLVGGATVGNKKVNFGGVQKEMAGLNVTAKNQSGTLTFTDYTVSDMKAFYNSASGFTIEAFYVNRVKSGTQGIVCGTEYGGLGMAESNSGVPGLCVYANDQKYTYTRGTTASSTSDLVHVIATTVVYDNCIYTSVYVNGELTDSKATVATNKSTTEIWMTDSRYAPYANQLSLGNDIGPSGFPTTNCTIVDVKIYAQALNPAQVKTAYDAAAALFAN